MLDRRTGVTTLAIGLVGLLLVVANHHLPVLRNGTVYARTALNLLEHQFDLRTVALDSKLSYYKPLGFPLLAAPLIPLFGPNSATVIASYLGGLAYLLATLGFLRHFNRRLGIDQRHTWLELLLVFLNPLALYQFWSAYPDALFAALFLLFFLAFDRAVRDDGASSWWMPVTYTALYLSVMVKQYGLVLLPLHVIYGLTYAREFVGNVLLRRRVRWIWAISLMTVVSLLAAAPFGLNPTLYLSLSGGAVTHYMGSLKALLPAVEAPTGDDEAGDEQPGPSGRFSRTHETRAALLRDNLNQLTVFVVLTFNLAALLAFRRRSANWATAGLAGVGLCYLGGLMLYKYTWFNMRFFLPVAPIIALFIVSGYRQLSRRWPGQAILAVALAFNALTSFNYNTRAGQNLFARFNSMVVPYSIPPRQFPYVSLDGLRMYWHLQHQLQFEHINKTLPRDATLFFVHVYYRGVSRGVYTRPGLLVPGMFRPDIQLEYLVRESDIPWDRADCSRPDHPCYKFRATKFRLPRPIPKPIDPDEPWYVDTGWGLYHIVPEQTAAWR